MIKRGAMWPEGPSRPRTRLAGIGHAVGMALGDPVIGILLLAGVAEILAGDPLVDWLVLLATAAALGWDRIRRRRPPEGEAVGVPSARATAGRVRAPRPADGSAPAQPGPRWVHGPVPVRLTRALVIGGLGYAVAA